MAVGRVQDSVEMELQFVQNASVLGRKRILPSKKNVCASDFSPVISTPKKRRSRRAFVDGSNRMEGLPQDLLVKILCNVDHSDLKQLLLVSKPLNQATLIARELHFAFSTPSMSILRHRLDATACDLEDSKETPYAPKQCRAARSRLDSVKLSSIAVSLFASSEEEWPKRGLDGENV